MAQNQMGMTGKNFGEEQPELKFKFNIGMEELRDIVQYLNRKPFEQNFTLLSFDELGPTESLELVNSIFAKIDKKNDVKLKDEGAEKTLDRFVEFLRILDYPGRFDDDTVKRFMLGDKKVLHPIIYYCLVNFEPLIKRAYINKFLLPIAVPDEYTVDDEVKRSYTDYQSLISEFRENHKVYEEKSKSANLSALKEEIISMEKDKENLASKIKEHQHKFENNADFQEILREITFQRKEQEDEATLIDKLRQQRRLLDRSKEELELALQKQFDAKRTIGEESSPDEMIFALKQEIARTKNKINEMTFELKERRKKIVENEKRLYEPLPSPDQIDAMKTKVSMLRNYVVDMNRKLESNRNQDKEDKLFIPKQQEMTVRKKKDTVEADMKKLEQEKEAAEDRLREKQKELDKMKGPGYAKKTEIGKYQEKYNEKRARQVKLDQELNELKADNNSLKETLSHLHNEKVEVDKRVRMYEKKYNVPGLRDKVVGIPTIIEQKEEFDLLKGKTLAEMSALVPELQAKLDSMKTKIQPLVTLHKNLKNEIAQLEPLHKEEKAKFDGITAEAKGGLDQAREKFSQEKAEVYEMDTKIETLNHQMKVMKVMVDMLNKEAEFQEGKKVLNPNYKSYKSWQQSELSSHDAVKTDLKQRREFLRKNYEKGKDQIGYLQTMEFLLQQKLQSKNFQGAANPNRFIEKRDGGADVLVMQNEY